MQCLTLERAIVAKKKRMLSEQELRDYLNGHPCGMRIEYQVYRVLTKYGPGTASDIITRIRLEQPKLGRNLTVHQVTQKIKWCEWLVKDYSVQRTPGIQQIIWHLNLSEDF